MKQSILCLLPPRPMRHWSTGLRRGFAVLGFALAAVAAWLVGTVLVGMVASAAPPAQPPDVGRLQRFEFTRVEMAMPVRILLYSESESTATTAANAAFDRFRELNGVLSDYDPESELRRLCRTAGTGACIPIRDDLWRVLERARQLSKATDGAFDVTIGPISRLWRRARRRRVRPPKEMLEEALERVDYRLVRLDPERQCVTLEKPRMRLDLGGIGKGYAIEQALLALRKKGIVRALVDAAGDIGVGEAPPGMPGWRIAVASLDPDAPREAFLWVTDRTIAHSGDAWQHVEIDGTRYSHIVDPKTGLGLTHQSSATVIARDAMTADALASALIVLGPERGLALIEKLPGVAARMMHAPDGHVKRYESSAWKQLHFAPSPEQSPQ